MFSRGFIAAMEDEAQMAELAIDDAGSDSMEADMVDVVDMSSDIEAGTGEMEQTVKDADQLERHVEVLTDAEGEGGASPELIEATEIAVEGIYARLGLHGSTGIPSLEAFSTKTGRARATRVAIEGISDSIKKIWEAVKSAFMRLVNYVKDFFSKLFDAKKKMLARITALEVKVKSIKGTPKETKVKGSGIGSIFGSDAGKKINEFLGSESELKSYSSQINEHLDTELPNLIKGASEQSAYDAYSFAPESGKDFSGSAPEGMKWIVWGDFGTSVLIFTTVKAAAKGKSAYQYASKSSVKSAKSATVTSSDSELKALDSSEMQKMLANSRSIVTVLLNEKSFSQSISEKLTKAVSDINRIISMADKNDENVGERAGIVRSAVTTTANNAIKQAVTINDIYLRNCQAVLTYVERSISNYSEDKKEDKK